MKNSLDGLSNRFEQTVAIISKFECSFIEIMQSEEQRGKKEWRKTDIQRMRDSTNYTPLHIIWIPKERRKRKEGEKVFEEIILENLLNLLENIIHLQSSTNSIG